MATGDTVTFSDECVYHLTPSPLCTPLTFLKGRSWRLLPQQLFCVYVCVNEQGFLVPFKLMCIHICRSMLSCICSPQEAVSHLSCCISSLCIFMSTVQTSKQALATCTLSIMETLWITEPYLHDSYDWMQMWKNIYSDNVCLCSSVCIQTLCLSL